MSFSICTLIQCNRKSVEKTEEIPIVSIPQIVTGAIDLVAIVGLLALAIIMLSNNANSHPLGAGAITNGTLPYILMGGSATFALADLIALGVQTCKKFNAIRETLETTQQNTQLRQQLIDLRQDLTGVRKQFDQVEQQFNQSQEDRRAEATTLKKQISELETQVQRRKSLESYGAGAPQLSKEK